MLLNNDPYAIFRVDWITVDSYIIIILVTLLILVKMYKVSARWRNPFSNEALEELRYEPSAIFLKNHPSIVKDIRFVRNTTEISNNLNKPVLILIRTHNKKKIVRVITEGLASYHFNVIIINNSPDIQQSIVPRIIEFLHEKDMILSSNYFLIKCGKSYFEILSPELEVINIGYHKRSFKNYETILLGSIIDKIENNSRS